MSRTISHVASMAQRSDVLFDGGVFNGGAGAAVISAILSSSTASTLGYCSRNCLFVFFFNQ